MGSWATQYGYTLPPSTAQNKRDARSTRAATSLTPQTLARLPATTPLGFISEEYASCPSIATHVIADYQDQHTAPSMLGGSGRRRMHGDLEGLEFLAFKDRLENRYAKLERRGDDLPPLLVPVHGWFQKVRRFFPSAEVLSVTSEFVFLMDELMDECGRHSGYVDDVRGNGYGDDVGAESVDALVHFAGRVESALRRCLEPSDRFWQDLENWWIRNQSGRVVSMDATVAPKVWYFFVWTEFPELRPILMAARDDDSTPVSHPGSEELGTAVSSGSADSRKKSGSQKTSDPGPQTTPGDLRDVAETGRAAAAAVPGVALGCAVAPSIIPCSESSRGLFAQNPAQFQELMKWKLTLVEFARMLKNEKHLRLFVESSLNEAAYETMYGRVAQLLRLLRNAMWHEDFRRDDPTREDLAAFRWSFVAEFFRWVRNTFEHFGDPKLPLWVQEPADQAGKRSKRFRGLLKDSRAFLLEWAADQLDVQESRRELEDAAKVEDIFILYVLRTFPEMLSDVSFARQAIKNGLGVFRNGQDGERGDGHSELHRAVMQEPPNVVRVREVLDKWGDGFSHKGRRITRKHLVVYRDKFGESALDKAEWYAEDGNHAEYRLIVGALVGAEKD